MLVTIRPAPGGIGGVIAAPPSKSMAHRAVLCAALAVGRSHITHLEFSKDISATLSAAAQLCAAVDTGADDAAVQGLGHFLPLTAPVDVPAQTLSAPSRQGFTLVEWGGTELP